MAHDLFKIQEINGKQYAYFNLKERNECFHAKRCYYRKAVTFLKFVSVYCNKIAIKGESDVKIARTLLGAQQPSYEKVLKTIALLMANYVDQYLLANINWHNAKRFKSKITYLGIDFEQLAYEIENIIFNNNLPAMWPTSGHKGVLYQQDIHSTMKNLFYIETVEKIEHLWNSDLTPGSMMYLRLFIDELMKEFIPYKSLVGAKGKVVNKTGVRRGFLDDEIKKRLKGQSSVLLDDGEILVYAYEWCCNSVHYGSLPLDCLASWLIMKISPIKAIFSNNATMKIDFEAYVTAKYSKEGLTVNWL